MKNWQIVVGIILISVGLIALFEALFLVDLWQFIGPLILIGLGVLLVLRPRIAGADVHVQMPILGEVRKTGAWEATRHEIWWVAGSNRFDFTETVFPKGDAGIRVIGFVADVKVILPDDVGLRVETSSVVSELKGVEGKQERILSPLEYETPNFKDAEKRVTLQTVSFVSDIRVKPPLL